MIKYNLLSATPCLAEIGGAIMRVVLCDDNITFLESFRSRIRDILKKNQLEGNIHLYQYAEDIPEHLISSCDIFFLDIDFREKSYTGIDLARKIREVNSDAIIVFVTNYIEYAPDGYEVHAFRYLLKSDIHTKLEPCLLQSVQKRQTEQETFQIHVSGEKITVPLTDVLYMESQGHQIIIHIQKAGAKTPQLYRFYASLGSLESQLCTQGFLRIQKSYLVNMRHIQKYRCNEAELDNGEKLPVSEKNYAEQKKQFLLWKGRQ